MVTGGGAVNDKVYIHEFIDITKQNRGKYMHHITANWSPIAQDQRNQMCFGVWGVLGSTGRWPQTVNLWEEDGFGGLAASFAIEVDGAAMQDPALERWWAGAADLRSGGVDRIMVPHPEMPTIERLCAAGCGAPVYAHELARVRPGAAADVLDCAVEESRSSAPDGWRLIGALRTVMGNDDEILFLWAIDAWPSWGHAEQRAASGESRLLPKTSGELLSRHRLLLVDAPLAPLRTGRQPQRADRTDWTD
ncbi:hypothetical protein [Humibacter sp.]|uniref:hypothetical protein n=1 Tax=Humibacter sp. TaxID=1940291 RepID=UPI002D80C6A3|nr:hypothetical protein [Humibacter sp.]